MLSTPAATLDLLTFSPSTMTLRASLHAAPESLQDVPVASSQLALQSASLLTWFCCTPGRC